MKSREDIHINAPPSKVWDVLSDPNLMELWNPKCAHSDAGPGPYTVGFTYKAGFTLGSRPPQVSDCTIEEYEPERCITTKYTGMAFKPDGEVTERYELTAKDNGTRLRQFVDYTHSGLPLFIRLIMKFIHTFGYSVGRGPLEGIKELAEDRPT